MKYKLYGILHKIAKKLLHRNIYSSTYRMISVLKKNLYVDDTLNIKSQELGTYINDMSPIPNLLKKEDVFPVENIVATGAFSSFNDSFVFQRKCRESELGINEIQAENIWMEFIENSEIPEGYKNGGLHYAGYILDCEEWCLPSWVWTNAALVRMYCFF